MQAHTFLYAESPPEYHVMFAALCESVRENAPLTELIAHEVNSVEVDLESAPEQRRRAEFIANVRKARYHRQVVERADDGQVLCFLDCDTLVLGEISALEFGCCDLMFTKGRHTSVNTGVYFVRASDVTREFIYRWELTASDLLFEYTKLRDLLPKYGGIHQAALGQLLRNSQFLEGLPAISYLPAEEWNCGDFQLHQFSDSTRIVHLTGMLRNAVFGRPIPKSIADQAGTIIEKFNQYACAVA